MDARLLVQDLQLNAQPIGVDSVAQLHGLHALYVFQRGQSASALVFAGRAALEFQLPGSTQIQRRFRAAAARGEQTESGQQPDAAAATVPTG